MAELEEKIVEAMIRLDAQVGGCHPHMFVFPTSQSTIAAFNSVAPEVHLDPPVMLVCRPEP